MSTVKYNYYDVPMVSNMEEMIALALKECPDKIVYKYKVKDEIRSMTYEAFVNRV